MLSLKYTSKLKKLLLDIAINIYFSNVINRFRQIFDYLGFLIHSYNSHGIHSPFVFSLYNEVLNVKKEYYCFEEIEKLRTSYLNNKQLIEMLDYGAGSVLGKSNKRKISDIANTSLQSVKHATLLFRLVEYFKPQNIIELGTSFGITTCYMAGVSKQIKVITIEGNPAIAKIAQMGFNKLNLDNIKLICGSFENHFEEVLKETGTVDFILFDGNHRYEPTIRYFKQALKYKNQHSVFIFDDIYWSLEMKKAWQEIIQSPQVTVSIDLFDMGIVFFKQGQHKQHFKLRI